MTVNVKNYATVTAGYWGFTLTDGAIRMLVVLYFHQLGYSPLAIASLFLFYEFFGIVTNLVGGWLGSRIGLNNTMHIGMGLQVAALMMLTVPTDYLTVAYVMLAQAISGVAKDLNKMSAKASVKLLIPKDAEQSASKLFKWVAVLTGSKNTLKGLGFFLGGLLLSVFGFQGALWVLAGSLSLILFSTWLLLPKDMGKTKQKAKFSQLFSNSPEINWLAAARFFLFGSRDVWFVVALPVYLSSTLLWQHEQTGAFFALWISAYGFVQALAPKLLNKHHPQAVTTQWLAWCLMFVPAVMALGLYLQWDASWLLIVGLAIYAIIFAINSAVHSYLIVEWSDADKVSMNVGFYYMANAGGRLFGTILSGLVFQLAGLQACLMLSALLVAAAAVLSRKL